jgi:DNA-binding LacI/PurR family transcriptional regulator
MDSELIAKKLCNIVLQMLAGKSVVPKVEFVPGMIVVRESAKLGNIEQ